MTRPKASRAIASTALVLACVLLPAGFVSHGHDDGSPDGHDHDCVVCCLGDHSVLAPAAAPVLAAPAPLASPAASNCAAPGFRTAFDSGLTRGPPA